MKIEHNLLIISNLKAFLSIYIITFNHDVFKFIINIEVFPKNVLK